MVNLNLNIISIHYLLWFAGQTSIFGYLSNYANHYANVSESIYGCFSMITAFSAIFVKPFFCSMADRRRAHREFFLACLFLAFLSSSILAVCAKLFKPVIGTELYLSRWIGMCSMFILFNFSTAVISCLTDTFAVNIAKRRNTTFGLIRVWGTVGWAASSLLLIYTNSFKPFLFPGLVSTSVFILLDLILVHFLPVEKDFQIDESKSGQTTEDLIRKIQTTQQVSGVNQSSTSDGLSKTVYGSTQIHEPVSNNKVFDKIEQDVNIEPIQTSNLRIQIELLKYIAKNRPSIFRYLFLFSITGALASLQWNYLFRYLGKIYGEKNGLYFDSLSMISQSILGELPFFLLANPIIHHLGKIHALSFSIATIGMRYLTYAYLLPNSNGHFVLLTEIFQGPNFGLFYVVLTSIGFDYSDCDNAIMHVVNMKLTSSDKPNIDRLRHNLHSSMMAVVSAAYEGLGVGLGSLIGGLAISYYDYEKVWVTSAGLAVVVGLVNSGIELFKTKPDCVKV